jgi:hypothetical protein
VQLGDAAAKPDERQLGPGSEHLDQRRGPDVLVYVEAQRISRPDEYQH